MNRRNEILSMHPGARFDKNVPVPDISQAQQARTQRHDHMLGILRGSGQIYADWLIEAPDVFRAPVWTSGDDSADAVSWLRVEYKGTGSNAWEWRVEGTSDGGRIEGATEMYLAFVLRSVERLAQTTTGVRFS